MDSVVKTEIKLSDDMVHQIVIAETAKALLSVPDIMEKMVEQVLFHRVPKKHSYDKENPTFYESVIRQTLKPMIEEEIKMVAGSHRKQLSAIIKKAFKAGVIDTAEFEKRLIEKLAKFTSNISFYVSDD